MLDDRVQLLSLVTQLLATSTEVKHPIVIANNLTGTIFTTGGTEVTAQYYPEYKKNHDDGIHGQFLIYFAHMDFLRPYLPSCDGLEYLSRVQHGFDTDDFPYDVIKQTVVERSEGFCQYIGDEIIDACMDAIERLFIYMKAAEKDPDFAEYLASSDNRCVIITDLPTLSSKLLALKNDCEKAVANFRELAPPYFFRNHFSRREVIMRWLEMM